MSRPICPSFVKGLTDKDGFMDCGYKKDEHISWDTLHEKEQEKEFERTLEADIFHRLQCTEELTIDFIKQTLKNIQLFDKKQKDYGHRNISRFGEQGILVRSSDKFERLVTLSNNPMFVVDPAVMTINELTIMSKPGKIVEIPKKQWSKISSNAPQNESINDTWQDISNYATMAIMVRAGVWPKY